MPVPVQEFQASWALISVRTPVRRDIENSAAWKQLVSLHAFMMLCCLSGAKLGVRLNLSVLSFECNTPMIHK